MNAKDAHGNAKLAWEDVRLIHKLRGVRSAAEVAREFRVGKQTILDIWNGRTWRKP